MRPPSNVNPTPDPAKMKAALQDFIDTELYPEGGGPRVVRLIPMLHPDGRETGLYTFELDDASQFNVRMNMLDLILN